MADIGTYIGMYIIQRWLALNTTRTQNEHEPTELRNATANRPGPEEPPEAAAAKATAESKKGYEQTTKRRDAKKGRKKPKQSKQNQPIALRIISALPVCNTLLYICQAYRMTPARSEFSKSSAHDRTKLIVSSAGRPPALKTSGTSSLPCDGYLKRFP